MITIREEERKKENVLNGGTIVADFKPINLTYYNPRTSFFKAGKNDRESYTLYSCSNCENCQAYKNHRCVMIGGLWGRRCPYGRISRKEGYTKSAKKCGELIESMKTRYPDIGYALKEQKALCQVGDYVWIPLPWLVNHVNSVREREFFWGEYFVKNEDFTAEFVVELVNFRPRALMGGEISDYKKKYVPEFVRQVKIGFPEKYEEALRIQPSVAELAEKVEYKGKKAKLSSLKPGRVKVGIYEVEWDGVRLYGKAREFGVDVEGDLEIRFGEGESEKTVATIVDEGTVGEETEIE